MSENILSWPKNISTEDRRIEWSYANSKGQHTVNFEEEIALAALLLSEVVFLNTHYDQNDWPEQARKTTALYVSTSDVFEWGCADAEEMLHEEIEEVYKYWIKDPCWGTAIWAFIKNNELPQRPVEKSIREKGIWDLDALIKEHKLRANLYDGTSHVLAMRKRNAYLAWCEEHNKEPLPFDGGWWAGWKEYTEAHPDWFNDDWKAEDTRAINNWRQENGF